MRIIDQDGNQVGVVPTVEGIRMAHEVGLDLVEVAPQSDPPVCRIMDFGKYKYKQKKRDHQAKKKSHASEVKEIRLKPKINSHDLDTKIRQAEEFIEEGYRVRINMMMKGRENTHVEIAEQVMEDFAVKMGDKVKVTKMPPENKRLMMLIVRK